MKDWLSPIPQNIHLIWIGTNDYPDYFKIFLKTFYKYFKGFNIKVWGNKDLNKKNFPIVNIKHTTPIPDHPKIV